MWHIIIVQNKNKNPCTQHHHICMYFNPHWQISFSTETKCNWLMALFPKFVFSFSLANWLHRGLVPVSFNIHLMLGCHYFFKKQAVTIYSNVAYNHICSGDHQWRIVDTAKSRISGQDIVLVLHRQKNITGQVKHPMKAGMLFFCFGTCPGFVKIDDAA